MTSQRTISMTLTCREPECGRPIRADLAVAGPGAAVCPSCQARPVFRVEQATVEFRSVTRCPLCNGIEFFVRRDFPQKIGLGLVVLFGVIASVLFYFERVAATFAVLGSLVFIDGIVFLLVGKVTVCYRCRAEFRNVDYNSGHKGFDLATSEKYQSITDKKK
ncbi:MAG: hypothetical protein O7B26_04655 [Planctomycetota bacterium]|nr:hypothetical protein [Planctomycetota bacterium]